MLWKGGKGRSLLHGKRRRMENLPSNLYERVKHAMKPHIYFKPY
jgi:hypothetical protein